MTHILIVVAFWQKKGIHEMISQRQKALECFANVTFKSAISHLNSDVVIVVWKFNCHKWSGRLSCSEWDAVVPR